MRKNVFDHSKIKEGRIACGHTQQECADFCGITYQQWQKWENGTNIPSAEFLGTIAECLYAEVSFFFVDSAEYRHRHGLDR